MIEELRPGLVVVGTAHISPQSVAEVETTIRQRRPRKVLVELDAKRMAALKDPDAWLNTDILQVLRQRKQHLFLLQLYLANLQARMGRDAGVAPGTELLRAMQVADEVGAEVVLIDRDIAITFRRGFGSMGFWAKLTLSWRVLKDMFSPAEGQVDMQGVLETQSDAITMMTDEFARFAPDIKVALLDERDTYMASHIQDHAHQLDPDGGTHPVRGGGLVAVVGAGHVTGIRNRLSDPKWNVVRSELDKPPPKRFPLVTVVNLAITFGIAGLIFWLVGRGEKQEAVELIWWWIGLHFVMAGAGAALALGHPLAVLTGALAAPFTSILPVGVKSGWLSGLVQATMRKPKVRDFQAIKTVERLGDFWRNDVVKVLTVTTLTILGSQAATWVFVIYVAGQVGGAT